MKYARLVKYIVFSLFITSFTHASLLEIKHTEEFNKMNPVVQKGDHFIEFSQPRLPFLKKEKTTKIANWQQLRAIDTALNATTPKFSNPNTNRQHGSAPEPETYILISLGILALISKGLHRTK
ncbi:hypothetical protein ACFQNF_20065 [Iodobacter arcticus]|uniref:PEP-CTERM protein-sorting domain-containing protein n=1 Tax=Iodobacter arcticus TaxID=590593 RepID=A0ABW2R2M2_9NEIS